MPQHEMAMNCWPDFSNFLEFSTVDTLHLSECCDIYLRNIYGGKKD